MADVRKLHTVAPPTAPEHVRADLIEKLERTLAEARAGEITELFMIVLHPDTDFSDRATPTENLTAWIGKLEIVKQRWINASLEYHSDEPR